jgi:tRNA-dihydrouridine synthase
VSRPCKDPLGPGYQVPLAQAVKQATGVTTMAVGLITEAKQAEEIVASGKADMIALARGMLYDPRWGWHAAAELGVRFCPAAILALAALDAEGAVRRHHVRDAVTALPSFFSFVMAGQRREARSLKDPAIHDFLPSRGQDVDARVKLRA